MRNRIVRYLKKHRGKVYRKRQMARLLGLQKSDYRKFRQELKNLFQEGVILRVRGGGFVWAEDIGRVIGKLVLNQKGFGFVLREKDDDIFVSSRNLKGAIHGDTVEVVVLPPTTYHRSEGQITKIIDRGTTEFVGTVIDRESTFHLEIEPITPRRGIKIIGSMQFDLDRGDTIVAKVIDWGMPKHPIEVEAVKILGSSINPEDDMKIICYKFDLDPQFPINVLKESKKFSEADIKGEIRNRTDFRNHHCFTIDPMDARDFDDAISLEQDDEGNTVVGVHIADVGFFVRQGSLLDREARKRGTSVYFAEGTVHMLPEILSSNLCSLLPGKDRLTLSILITLNQSCQVIRSSFHASITRNKRRFTYREVQAILDDKEKSQFAEKLKKMHVLSQKLLEWRQKRGSIDFDIPEPIFRFQNGGIPHEILPSERLDSHRLVEEFMLLANRVVAKTIGETENGRVPFIYRIHDEPTQSDMGRFLEVLRRLQLYDGKNSSLTPMEFRNILSRVEDSPYKALIENLALRTMTKAVYSTENRGHYGLAFKAYTHFTSPIRRYPDLIVHRHVKTYILKEQQQVTISRKSIKSIAKESTESEIRAMEAERDYIKIKQIRWLSRQIGKKFEGIISGVISPGFFVELKDTMVEGFVPIDSLHDDSYFYDDRDFAIVGRRWGEKYQMGKEVAIIVQDVIVEKRQVNFKVIV